MSTRSSMLALVVFGLTRGGPAPADDTIPGHVIDRDAAGLVIGSAVLASLSLMAIPVRTERSLWKSELFDEIDAAAHDNFSRRAGGISDATLALTVAAPVIYLTGTTIDDADGDRLLIYGEALAVNLALNSAAKYIVQRPRPYLYNQSAAARQRARDKGSDSRLSFYSGHAAMSFCAATTGAYLLSTSTDSKALRTTAWAAGLGLAAVTSNLRVRAGEHFYSDVLIGGIVGIAVGYAVPALHADDKAIVPSGQEVALGGVGILAGLLVSQLIPLGKDKRATDESAGVLDRVQLTPIAIANGAGLGIAGRM